MATTFKCLASGQTVTFVHQVDIDSMKGHAGYVEVTTEAAQEEPTPVTANKKASTKKTVDTSSEE
jgi:hypothetical protein